MKQISGNGIEEADRPSLNMNSLKKDRKCNWHKLQPKSLQCHPTWRELIYSNSPIQDKAISFWGVSQCPAWFSMQVECASITYQFICIPRNKASHILQKQTNKTKQPHTKEEFSLQLCAMAMCLLPAFLWGKKNFCWTKKKKFFPYSFWLYGHHMVFAVHTKLGMVCPTAFQSQK